MKINAPKKTNFVENYGYNKCFHLSIALAKKYDLNIGIVETYPNGIPIHAFVIKDELAVDAHGINQYINIIKKYEYVLEKHPDDECLHVNIMDRINGVNILSYLSGDPSDENEIVELFHQIYPEIIL